MRKGIILKLLAFMVVLSLLSLPVFAKPRIKALDLLMDNMIVNEVNAVEEIRTGKTEFLIKFVNKQDAIKELLRKIHKTSVYLLNTKRYSDIIEYTLSNNPETTKAIEDIINNEDMLSSTAKYYDEFWCSNVEIVFTKTKTSKFLLIKCEVIMEY